MYRAEAASFVSFDELVATEARMGKGENVAPTVDGLIFMDCAPNPKKKNKRQLFACYVTQVELDKEKKPIAVQVGIIQWVKGTPQVLLVKVSKETVEKGTKIRFWDLPPTTRLMKENPFPELKEKEEEKKA